VEDRLVRQPEKHSREDALSTCLSSYWFALSQLLMLFCCAYCDRSSVPDARVGFDCFQPYEKINSENLIRCCGHMCSILKLSSAACGDFA